MQVKRAVMVLAACCAVAMISGCVSDEDHQVVVDQLAASQNQVTQLQADLENLKSALSAETSKLTNAVKHSEMLDGKIKDLEKREAGTAKALAEANMAIGEIEKALVKAEEKSLSLVAAKQKVEAKHEELMAEYEKLLSKYEQYKKNQEMLASLAPTAPSSASAPAASSSTENVDPAEVEEPAAAANPEELTNILDGMLSM